MGCLTTIREEFRIKKFGFADVYPDRFYMWHWRVPPFLYLLYRIVLALYVDFWLIYFGVNSSGIAFSNGIGWGAFLTIWTYIVLAIYLTVQCLIAFVYFCCHRRQSTNFFKCSSPEIHHNTFPEICSEPWLDGYETVPDVDMEMEFRLYKLPWYLIIAWILLSVVSAASLMVTVVFFAFLLPQFSEMSAGSLDNVQLHILNSVIVIAEHLTTAIPFRLLHVIYPIIYGLIYMLFSIFYWIPDHSRVIYPKVLDWNQPGTTILMILLIGFIFIPLLHTLFFLIYRLKIWIMKSFS